MRKGVMRMFSTKISLCESGSVLNTNKATNRRLLQQQNQSHLEETRGRSKSPLRKYSAKGALWNDKKSLKRQSFQCVMIFTAC